LNVDRIGAADRGVVELLDELVASVLREGFNGLALPLVTVLVGADVGRRPRPQYDSAGVAAVMMR